MELTPELLGTAGVGAVVLIGAIGNYLRSLREKPRASDPVIAGIGLAFGDREQSERMISALTRMAAAMEILADRRTDEMADIQKALLERLDAQERREEQEQERSRRPPRRRS